MAAADEDLRRRFLSDLLLSSPPGQFDVVLKNLQTILSASGKDDLMNAEWVETIRAQYDSSKKGTAAASSHALTSLLQEEMSKYAKECYSSKGVVSTSVVNDGGAANSLAIKSYSERIDEKNYHGGSWAADWQINTTEGDTVTMSGTVDLVGHSYEEGRNFCLESHFNLPSTTVQPASAEAIVEQISQWESTSVLQSLNDMHSTMTDQTLKSLRRVMPVTRTKMDWNVANHRAKKLLANNPVK